MVNKHILSVIVIGLWIWVGCGGNGQTNELQKKREELKELRAELLETSEKIKKLEAEIAQLDTTKREIKQLPIQVMTLNAQSFEHYVKVQGQVEANKNIMVSPQSAGRITQIYVSEGQSVSKGKLLAKIDDAVMRRSINEVETSLKLANTLYEKQQKLWDQEIGTEVQLLTAKNQKEALEKKLATLREQLSYSDIVAPISGTIDEILPKTGEMASPGIPAFKIVNFSDLMLKAAVAEAYVPYIKKGDQVKIFFSALDKTLSGRVKRVGAEIDPMARTFVIEIKLPSDKLLKPNMFGEVSINDRTVNNAIVIPAGIVQRAETSEFVYILQNRGDKQVAKRQAIKTGLTTDGYVEVTEGLKPGDQLITVGYQELSDGQPVSIPKDVISAPAEEKEEEAE